MANPRRKIAPATPNSATKAGSSRDCDSASENGPYRKRGSSGTGPSPRTGAPAADSSALIRLVMNAAMAALPSTAPTCRVVL